MLRLIRPISALLLSCALLLLGNGLLNTVLVLRGSLEGISDQALGMVMSGYFVGFLLGGYLAVPLVRRLGHIRAFAFAAALFACCVLAYILWVNFWFWLALRVLTGYALVVLYTVMESWLNGQTEREHRGRVFSIYMVVNLGALALAQQLIQLDSPSNFTLFAVAGFFAAAAVMPITCTRMTPPPLQQTPMLHVGALYRAAPVAITGSLLSGLAMGAFWGMAPLFISNMGYRPTEIAAFMSLAIVGGALLQLPMGHYSDNHDRRKVMAVIALAAALSALLIWFLGRLEQRPLPLLYLAGAAYGGFAFAVQPIAVAHLIDHLEPKDVLSGSTGLLQLHGIGSVFGPALGGLLMGSLGALALPGYFLAMHLLLAVYVVVAINLSGRPDESEAQHGHFVPMLRTSPTILAEHPDQPATQDAPAYGRREND